MRHSSQQHENLIPRKKRLKILAMRLFVAFAGILLTTLIVLQLVIWTGLLWLRSDSGAQWLQTKLADFAAQSGYHVTLEGLKSHGVIGLEADHIEINDAQGLLAQVQDLRVRFGLLSLPFGSLAFWAQVSDVEILRIPNQTSANSDQVASSSDSDFFLKKIRIDGLSIDRLHLSKDVAGRDIVTGLKVQATGAMRNETVSLKADVDLQHDDPLLPEQVRVDLQANKQTLAINLSELKIEGRDYHLYASGYTTADALDMRLFARTRNMQEFGLAGNITLRVTGSMDTPIIAARGFLNVSDDLVPGLGPVRLDIYPDGRLLVASSYQGRAVRLSSLYAIDQNQITLSDISGNAPDAELEGHLKFNRNTSLMAGEINFKALLESYEDVFKMQSRGEISAGIILKSRSDQSFQDIQARLSLSQVLLGEMSVDKMDLIVNPKASGYDVRLSGNGYHAAPFDISGRTFITAEGGIQDLNMTLSLLQGALRLTGRADLKQADLLLSAEDVSLGALPIEIPQDFSTPRLNGKATLTGALSAPEFLANFDLRGTDANSTLLTLKASYNQQDFNAELQGKGQGIHQLSAEVYLPFNLSIYPFVLDDLAHVPLQANVSGDLDLKSLQDFLSAGDEISGRLKTMIKAQGPLVKPSVQGSFNLQQGAFIHGQSDIALQDIVALARLENDTVVLQNFQASDQREGKISAQGQLGLFKESLPVDLKLRATDINPFKEGYALTGVFSGAVDLHGNQNAYAMTGEVDVGRLEIEIPERFSSDIASLNVVRKGTRRVMPAVATQVKLDMTLKAKDQVFVRGWGLDAEFGGALDVTGTLEEPLLNGTFESRRGRYEEFGKRFDLQHARLRFQGSVPPSPYLDILASTRAGDVNARIALTGNIRKPAIALSSVPSLPQDEVLSRILFGKDMGAISPFQAVQLANTLRRFTGRGGGFSPLSLLRKATGLDDLQVESDGEGGTIVGAGKYITDKVYLEAETGSGESSGAARITIDLTPNLKAETKFGEDNKAGGSLQWQWDY